MKPMQVFCGAACAVALVLALSMLGSAPAKKGNVTAYVRFEIANPVTSYDTLDSNPPAPDPERMLRTEAARMVDDSALDAATSEIVSLGLQPPTIDDLRTIVRAEVVPGTYFVDLTASATTESDALAIVAAFADGYRHRFFNHRDLVLRDRIELLDRVIRDCRADIEQIEARSSSLMAKEKLTRVLDYSENPRTNELRQITEAITNIRIERWKRAASGAPPEDQAVQEKVLAELEDRQQVLMLRLESEAHALYVLQSYTAERDAKANLVRELQRDVGHLRIQKANQESAYPSVRALNKPRVRASR